MTFLNELQDLHRQKATESSEAERAKKTEHEAYRKAATEAGRQQAHTMIERIRGMMLVAAGRKKNRLEIREWEGLEKPTQYERDDVAYGAFIGMVGFLLGPEFSVTGSGSFEVYPIDEPGMEHSKSIHIQWNAP